jgi:hypothetical protein
MYLVTPKYTSCMSQSTILTAFSEVTGMLRARIPLPPRFVHTSTSRPDGQVYDGTFSERCRVLSQAACEAQGHMAMHARLANVTYPWGRMAMGTAHCICTHCRHWIYLSSGEYNSPLDRSVSLMLVLGYSRGYSGSE